MDYYNNIPVLLMQPDFATRPKLELKNEIIRFDGKSGKNIGVFSDKTATRVVEHTYKLEDEEEVDVLEEFIDSMNGRAGEFYILTWLNQLHFKSLDDNVLTIKSCNFSRNYEALGDTELFILNQEMEMYMGSVISSTIGAEEDTITLASTPEGTYTEGNTMVGFMYKVRLLDDSIDFTVKSNITEVKLSFKQLIVEDQRETIEFYDREEITTDALFTSNSFSGLLSEVVIENNYTEELYAVQEWSGTLLETVIEQIMDPDELSIESSEWEGSLQSTVISGFFVGEPGTVTGLSYTLNFTLGGVGGTSAPWEDDLTTNQEFNGSLNSI